MGSKITGKETAKKDRIVILDRILDELLNYLDIRGSHVLAVCRVFSALELAKCDELTIRDKGGTLTSHLAYKATDELEELIDDSEIMNL